MTDTQDTPSALERLTQAGLTVNLQDLQDRPTVVTHRSGAGTEQANATPRLGRYIITGHLGAGGMGEVLQVKDEDVGREMAAKVILGDATGPALTKFIQEAQITGQLEHPNIVPMHELGMTADNRIYFTMKRVEGETLAELFAAQREVEGAMVASASGRRKAVFSLATTRRQFLQKMLNIFLKMCNAIAFAHSRGVIHRDLKPANIMVGRFGEVQVMDWGLAKVVGEPDPVADGCTLDLGAGPLAAEQGALKTLDGSVVGTPAYMPPEQARGDVDKLDSRADIYALGAVLYEILTLVPPYEGDDLWQVLQDVRDGALVAPREQAPHRELPWELEAVVVKAMAPSMKARYAAVDSLREDVQAYLGGRLLLAARYSVAQRAARWIWSRRKGLIAAGLLIAAVLSGGLALWQSRKATSALAKTNLADARAAEAELKRKVEERVSPLVATLKLARLHLYIERIEIAPHIKRVRGALRNLEELTLVPALRKRPDLWGAIGRGRFFLGDLVGAEEALLRAAASEECPARVASALGQVYVRLGMDANLGHAYERQRFCFRQAARYLSRGGFGEKSLEVKLMQIFAVAATGKLEKTRMYARRALEQHTDEMGSEELYLLIAWSHLTHKKSCSNELLIEACDAALKRRPHRLRLAHKLRGHARYHQGDLDGAIADYGRALELEPGDALTYCNRGLAQATKGQPDAAIADYTQALRIDPRFAVAYHNRAIALSGKGKYGNALVDHDKALELDPRLDDAHTMRGLTRLAIGDLDGAIADFGLAIEINPRDANAFRSRGRTRMKKGDLDDALADYTRSLAINPRIAAAWYNRGNARLKKRDAKGALRDYDRALKIQSQDWRALGNRGFALKVLGRRKEAVVSLRRALKLAPKQVKAGLLERIRRLTRPSRK